MSKMSAADIYWMERCDRAEKRVKELEAERTKLRLLIRCEQIVPPFDVTDDMTTEFSVELAELQEEVAKLKAVA